MNESDGIQVCFLHIDEVCSMDPAILAERLPERWRRAQRFRFERDRLLCLGAGWLMLKCLGLEREEQLRYGPFGKPYLLDGPFFNLSHSGSWCMLAMGKGELGADIEEMNPKHLEIAPSIFTPGELAWMKENPLERFYQLWTWKESVMKATGLGVNLEPADFEVLPFLADAPVVIRGKQWYAKGGQWDQCRYSVCGDTTFQIKTEEGSLRNR